MSYTASQMPAVITANYTIQPYDEVIRYDSTGGIFNIQLPDPSLGRRQLKFVGVAGDAGVNLVPYGSEKICGSAATLTLSINYSGPYVNSSLFSDLTDWLPDGWVNV